MRLARHGAILCGVCLMSVAALGGSDSSSSIGNGPSSKSVYARRAEAGVERLQQWYAQSSGLYAKPSGWWNAANAITVLADYSRASGSTQYLSAIRNTFENASRASGTTNFINEYDDDEGWWALAWIDAYDLTQSPEYLAMAETIFADIASEWDVSTCGGGVWWQKPAIYKNAIANELFLEVAASLANRTTGKESTFYKAWADKEWAWFKGSGMINSQNLVNDGLSSTNPNACRNNGQTAWSYNQGVILGGLVELSKAEGDPEIVAQAEAIAKAAIAKLTVKGILTESVVSGNDAPQFKGIFVRNLAKLDKVTPDALYKTFIDTNADSIWANDQGQDHEFGALWQGPMDSADAIRQSSALDVLVAAMEVQ
jgi:predicted alpha-1,6-mannanase (GH76 family)